MPPDRPTPPGYRASDTPERPAPSDRSSREIRVESARELDRRCAEQYAIPPLLLMENAALGLLDEALEMLGDTETETETETDSETWIVAGPGNNGGDGLALARHLHNHGRRVRVFLTHPDRESGAEAGAYRAMLGALGVACEPIGAMPEAACPALVVDAVLGTGLDRAPEGAVADAIARINALGDAGARVLACDIPSGLDATSGRVPGDGAVHAERTVTFVAPKPGFASIEAQRRIGELVVKGIGAPRALVESLTTRIEPAPDRDPA